MVAFVLLASGCQSSEPLVPREIYQQVNDDGREWTYDTAWQNIRALNADLDASELSELSEQALFIASQMERLEKGKLPLSPALGLALSSRRYRVMPATCLSSRP